MVIHCSKALQTALKIKKVDLATSEQLEKEIDSLYSWHGHIAKIGGRNTIVLMNDKTMYCLLFRNKLPRNKEKFTELMLEAIPYTFETGIVNVAEIINYMSSVGSIIYADKSDRQITGNIKRMILDMEYGWDYKWVEDETIQAYEALELNRGLRKMGKDYVVPFEEMLNELCKLSDNA